MPHRFRNRLTEFVGASTKEADAVALRGLLALEEGDRDEAEISFREALSIWKDEATAASGGGLDFHGRRLAQDG